MLTASERATIESSARFIQSNAKWLAERARELRVEDPDGWLANIHAYQDQARTQALTANILVRALLYDQEV